MCSHTNSVKTSRNKVDMHPSIKGRRKGIYVLTSHTGVQRIPKLLSGLNPPPLKYDQLVIWGSLIGAWYNSSGMTWYNKDTGYFSPGYSLRMSKWDPERPKPPDFVEFMTEMDATSFKSNPTAHACQTSMDFQQTNDVILVRASKGHHNISAFSSTNSRGYGSYIVSPCPTSGRFEKVCVTKKWPVTTT